MPPRALPGLEWVAVLRNQTPVWWKGCGRAKWQEISRLRKRGATGSVAPREEGRQISGIMDDCGRVDDRGRDHPNRVRCASDGLLHSTNDGCDPSKSCEP